jgi:acyl-CoA thioesterase-2
VADAAGSTETSRDATKVERLLALISPAPIADNRFAIDVSEHVEGHLFGGLVAAQALHAAYTTVDGSRRAQSAHAYFLRRGRPELPIEFEVHRDTDGRSFSARRVAATQEGRPMFTMVCSFHVPEETERVLPSMPEGVADPTSLPIQLLHTLDGCFEVRHPEVAEVDDVEVGVPGLLWIRAAGPLPDDPMLHDCLLFYASDMGMPWNVMAPAHEHTIVSLDHAIWLHGSTRMDEWHHLALEPVALADSRGHYTGRMWHHSGAYVASLAQENLIRPITA